MKKLFSIPMIIALLLAVALAGCGEEKEAPEAAFSASPLSGDAPLSVQFTDQSTGEVDDWAWDFGDNTNSTAQNPSHTYETAGNYSVSLQVTGPGGSDTETKTDYIQAREGELPTYTVGYQWVYSWVQDTAEYTMTQNVTGEEVVEGRDCYAMDWLFEPPMGGMGVMEYWVDKETISLFSKMQSSYEYGNQTYTYTTISSYELIEGSYWPLEVGKGFTMEGTENTTVTMNGQVVSQNSTTSTYIGEVEKKEEVTVPAGKFNCFKMVMTDEDGNLMYVSWSSDKVKSGVKSIAYDEGGNITRTMELKSYSV